MERIVSALLVAVGRLGGGCHEKLTADELVLLLLAAVERAEAGFD